MGFSLVYSNSTIRVGTREALIGRSPACKVVLNDEAVSRRHARISQTQDGFVLEDLGSANGVHINGEQVEGTHTLQDGDIIVIGTHRLEFKHQPPPTPASMRRRQRHTGSALDNLWDDVEPEIAAFTRGKTTRRRDRLVMLGAAADIDIAAGNLPSAERLLKKELMRMLVRAEEAISTAALDDCVRYALALCREDSPTDWIEYVLMLLTVARSGVGELARAQLKRHLEAGLHPVLLEEYLKVLRNSKERRAAATYQQLRGLQPPGFGKR